MTTEQEAAPPADTTMAPQRTAGAAPAGALRLRRWTAPAGVTILLIAGLWLAHLPLLSEGGLRLYDEFHTLDRSSAFALHDDWLTTYSNQEPSFRKPPLQYWMTALLLEGGVDPLIALRLPSMAFALLALLAVALLAAVVVPALPWAMPAAVALFAASAQFWEYALSGLLETGAVAFATLALAFAILALRRPAMWYAAAAVIVLGALQKAPIGLALVGVYLWALHLTRRWHGRGFATVRSERPFRLAWRISLAGVLAWPLLQTVLNDIEAISKFIGQQMLERFAPTGMVTRQRDPQELYELLVVGEPLLRGAFAAALVWLPFRLGRRELLALPVTVAIAAIGIAVAAGHVTERYVLSVVPLGAVALAAVLVSLARPAWPGLAAAACLAAISVVAVRPFGTLHLGPSDSYAHQAAVLSEVGAALGPDETLLVCTVSGPHRFVPALASYAASNGRPFLRLDRREELAEYDAAGRLGGPLRGACTPEDLALFEEAFEGLEIVASRPPYVIWIAERARPLPEDPR